MITNRTPRPPERALIALPARTFGVFRSIVWALLAIAAVVVPVHSVAAEDGADTTERAVPTVDAVLGVAGLARPSAASVLAVTVSSPTAMSGSIEVRGGSTTIRRSIEMAGGTTKTVHVIIPARLLDVIVTLFNGDSVITTKNVSARTADDHELVGVFPGAAASSGVVPAQVPLASDLGRAQLVTLDADTLRLGSGALAQFGTLVATTTDVAADPTMTALVGAWVAHGGALVITDSTAGAALPDVLRPAAAGFRAYALGMVIAAKAPTTPAEWARIVVPSPRQVSDHPDQFSDASAVQNLGPSLVSKSGIRLLTLLPVVLPLLIYLVVASLGTYLVLRRMRRMTAAWVVVPALAVAFSLFIALFTAPDRSSDHRASARLIDCSDLTCSEFRSVLLTTSDGSTATIDLGTSGNLGTNADWFSTDLGAPTTVSAAEDGQRHVSVDLQPGQVAIIPTVGPTTEQPVLAVVASTAADGTVTGTVTNRSASIVERVAVAGDGVAVSVGDLDAGGSATFALKDVGWRAGQPSDEQVWSIAALDRNWRAMGDEALAGALWASAGSTTNLVGSGTVRAFGWVDGVGASPDTLTSTTLRISAAPGSAPAPAVRMVTVRSSFASGVPSPSVFRATLPSTWTASTSLVVRTTTGKRLDVLVNGAWTTLPVGENVTVPPAAVSRGVILLRDSIPDPISGRIDVPTLFHLDGGAR